MMMNETDPLPYLYAKVVAGRKLHENEARSCIARCFIKPCGNLQKPCGNLAET